MDQTILYRCKQLCSKQQVVFRIFNLSRGVRQGCPLSPYLFILCAEVLGNAVRKDKEIRGIKIGTTDCKFSQYADDTTMILDGSELSFSKTLNLFDKFSNISGLKVNYEKTEALWIGSCKKFQQDYSVKQADILGGEESLCPGRLVFDSRSQ